MSRLGLGMSKTALKSSAVYRPTLVRGIKTIPQPPGYIVGTVNDAYVPPKPNKTHGSLHWAREKVVTVAMIPFIGYPFLAGTTTFVDASMSGLLLYHCYVGFQSCIIDYIPKRVYGAYHNYAMYLLTFGSGVAAYGIYELEKKEGGVTTIISKLWKA
ncbi:hypothetical protein CANTEDRAFT_112442 [Yamadazyma tenuis ATCC 10573]|uniref:Succinate dehydrogenase [ubiquinone] cytochrome b small subunit n=2 Tax=Candida tenuis TaxID=2315449 RepID=G3AX70_CANTC|nr:uncharacterized protein CANTEDRAFT_112442 [Yamadazyma tenuis ATCC 10573]EGV66703.1 hypothetical protein CANTEDRAFT_112442 [Yamadazyma tenuis ATCC 10573]